MGVAELTSHRRRLGLVNAAGRDVHTATEEGSGDSTSCGDGGDHEEGARIAMR
jgi:hypothetical protein